MSIKRRPAQPVLLVLVLTIAMTMGICCLDIGINMPENDQKESEAKYGKADYVLSVDSASSSRFIMDKEVESVLPSGVKSCGVMTVPMVFGDRDVLINGVATDLATIYDIFDIQLLRSIPLTTTKRKEGIFITEQFAEEHGLDIGSSLPLSVFGKEKVFSVYGISEKKLLAQYDALFDTQAIINVLGQDSAFLAYIGDEFSPVSQVYLLTGDKTEETIAILTERYADMTLSTTDSHFGQKMVDLSTIIYIVVASAVFFSMVVIYCCFHILSVKRREETDLFYGLGCKTYMLNLLSAVELFIYWAVGAVLGIVISIPATGAVIRSAALEYVSATIHPQSILIAAAANLFSAEFSLVVYILADEVKKRRRQKKVAVQKNKDKTDKRLMIIFGSIGLICLGLTFVPMDASAKLVLSLIPFFCFAMLGFFLGRESIVWLAKIATKKKKSKTHVLYANKNLLRVRTLGNTVGLITVFFISLCMILLLYQITAGALPAIDNTYKGDFVALNVTSEARNKLEETEGVEQVVGVFFGSATVIDTETIIMYADSTDILSDLYPVERLPKEDEIFLGSATATKYGLNIGDTVSVTYGNDRYEFVYAYCVVTGEIETMVNADAMGIRCDTLFISGQEGYNKEELEMNIKETLAYESATVIPQEEFLSKLLDGQHKYKVVLRIIILFLLVFAVIGLGDNVVASYRSRREEFLCYASAGMSKKQIGKMICNEILICLGVGMLIFAVLIVPIFVSLCQTTLSFAVDFVIRLRANILGALGWL